MLQTELDARGVPVVAAPPTPAVTVTPSAPLAVRAAASVTAPPVRPKPASPAPPDKPAAVKTPRGRIREWVTQNIQGQPSIDIPQLADSAIEQLARDASFVQAYLRSEVRPFIVDQIRTIIAETRPQTGLTLMGDMAVSPEEFRKRSHALRTKFWKSYEHVPGRGHVLLFTMTKGELLAAAQERRTRGMIELRTADLLERLAADMRDGETVQDHYQPDDIEHIAAQIAGRTDDGDFQQQEHALHALPGDPATAGQDHGGRAA